jgi:LysM repeat protein
LFDDHGPHWPAPGYLIAGGVLAAVILVVMASLAGIAVVNSMGESEETAPAPSTSVSAKLPVYWTVRSGETLSDIAAKTGLSVAQLESFNPSLDTASLVPGQRVQLRAQVPRPRPKPRGPRFWTVRPGQSFGSIAERTGRSIARLQQLNPKLKPEKLQPGDRVRLRP